MTQEEKIDQAIWFAVRELLTHFRNFPEVEPLEIVKELGLTKENVEKYNIPTRGTKRDYKCVWTPNLYQQQAAFWKTDLWKSILVRVKAEPFKFVPFFTEVLSKNRFTSLWKEVPNYGPNKKAIETLKGMIQ